MLKVRLKLQGSNSLIGEDFCARVRDIRRKLTPHLKAKRNEGCLVSIVFDRLLVDRKRFTVDYYDNLTEIKQEVGRSSHRKQPGQICDSISACDAMGITYCGLTPCRYLHEGDSVNASPSHTRTHARTHARTYTRRRTH